MNESKVFKLNLTFGQWLYNFFLLQVLPILYTIKGFVFLGLFPSIASLFNIFYQWITFKKLDLDIPKHFKQFYKDYFWQANKLGWSITIVGAILLFDLYVSVTFIQSVLLHNLLLLLFFIYLTISSYLFSVFARYDYGNTMAYIKQSFYIGLASIFQSIAIFVSMIVLYFVFTAVPFVLLFFGLPLFFGAIAWFAVQGIKKAETMNQTKE